MCVCAIAKKEARNLRRKVGQEGMKEVGGRKEGK